MQYSLMSFELEKLTKSLGPGIITGAADDDPSGIATYTQAGSQFGLGLLWTALLTFPLMVSIQEMCGRIGLVTKQGLASVIKKNYPRWVLLLICLTTIPAIIFNIAANFAAMGAVSSLVSPQIHPDIFVLVFALIMIVGIVFLSYKVFASVLKWLALVLFSYAVIPFLIGTNWLDVFYATITPRIEFTKEYIALLVAILGTTISPYLFFWESSMEVEEQKASKKEHKPLTTLALMRVDNAVGMFFSNVIMFFIILTAGTVLFQNGTGTIATVDEAAKALLPLAGQYAYLLFAVGVVGIGLLSIPVLAGVCGYIIAETLNWKEGMNNTVQQSPAFYLVIVASIVFAVGINLLGIDPIQALLATAILYGVIAPVLIFLILQIANNKKILGKNTNTWLSNTFGYLCLACMTLAVIALAYTSFF